MSAWVGDYRVGKTIRKMWNTNAIAGESITRSTDGTVSVYKDGGTTQSTAGVSGSEDFDGLTGVHLTTIDTSADGTFYSAGSDFEVVLSAATIDGKTINATLFSFSLENRSALMPTTDGRKLDVSSGGEAGVDWANVGSPTTTLNLSGTTIKEVTDVQTKLGTPAGASISADIAAIEGQTDDIGAAGAGLTAIPWNASWDAEVQSEVADALIAIGLDHLISASVAGSDVADDSIVAKLVSKSATADWDDFVNTTESLQALRDNELTSILEDTGTTLQAELDGIQADTEDIQSRLPAALVSGRIDASVGAMAANVITASALNADAVDEIWDEAMTELSAVPAVTASLRDALRWIFLQSRNKITQTSTTQALRNDADSGNVATAAISDDGTTFTRAEWGA